MGRPNFRAGVVAVVRRSDGLVMAFERSDVTGQWQLPQGGIESGETPEAAAWRELHEETGLTSGEVDLVGEFPEWTVYVWPTEMREGDRLGQAHRWFFFDVRNDTVQPTPDGDEFVAWSWMTTDALIEQVVEFRAVPYRQVLGG